MSFTGKRIEILPWVVVAFMGAGLGRNICHHTGWAWWIGFTVFPALFVLAGLGLNALIRKIAARSRKDAPH